MSYSPTPGLSLPSLSALCSRVITVLFYLSDLENIVNAGLFLYADITICFFAMKSFSMLY